MKVLGDVLGPPRSTDKTTLLQNSIEGKLLEWLNIYLCQRKQKVGLKSGFSGLKSIFA